jgi:hypothetical protein
MYESPPPEVGHRSGKPKFSINVHVPVTNNAIHDVIADLRASSGFPDL